MHQLVQTRDPLDEVVVQEEPLEREQRLQVLHLNIAKVVRLDDMVT